MRKREERAVFCVPQNEQSNIKNVIGIVSGKGGVGKSLVTSLLASAMNKRGYTTAILDADITGPSIPKSFGVSGLLQAFPDGTYPAYSRNGIKMVSTNLILDEATTPVVWRGPVLSGAIKQFWQDIVWGNVDYMFVDLPPGTSDATLTVFQSIPLLGIIIVTTPQDLVSMIVDKAINMAKMIGIPVMGLVENYSYFIAPDTKNTYEIFGKSKIEQISGERNLDILARIPIDPEITQKIDNGQAEDISTEFVEYAIDKILDFKE